MAGCFRQAADFAFQVFPVDLLGIAYVFANHQLGESGPACHRRDASLGPKANIGDAISLQPQAKLENIAAYGVFQPRARIGRFDRSRVSRILKMVQDFRRVHRPIVMRACGVFSLNGSGRLIRTPVSKCLKTGAVRQV